jgi:hypothetical protein
LKKIESADELGPQDFIGYGDSETGNPANKDAQACNPGAEAVH